jgi:excisionase family DNA binding protein
MGKQPKNRNDLLDLYLSATPAKRERLFVSTSKAAKRFGISQRTLELRIKRRDILAIRLGRNYRVYVPAVQRYIAQ